MGDATVIKLADKYCDDVLQGLKVSTIRKGHRQYRLGSGILRTPTVDIGIEIQRVTHCKYYDLTEEDAYRDGFASLHRLQEALRGFYPDIEFDYEGEITIVGFGHPILVWRSM